MKKTTVCPKCSSSTVLRIPGQAGAYGTGNNIKHGTFVWNHIPVSRYVCADCGYSEEWIDKKTDLRKLKEKYAR